MFGNAAWAVGEIFTLHPEIDDGVAYPMFRLGYLAVREGAGRLSFDAVVHFILVYLALFFYLLHFACEVNTSLRLFPFLTFLTPRGLPYVQTRVPRGKRRG